MRRKRYYLGGGRNYCLCFRAKSGLPFVPIKTVKLLIESAVARSQRDNKVKICHDLWMTNHVHLYCTFQDINQARNFHMEVKKKITDYFKRLLGLKKLNIWEEDDSVYEVIDLQSAIYQIAYLYANPSKANLVSAIDNYIGVNSWQCFINSDSSLEAKSEKKVPWIRQPAIKRLASRKISRTQDNHYYNLLAKSSSESFSIIREPNAWMRVFGVTEQEEINKVNLQIVNTVRQMEKEHELERLRRSKKVLGASKLIKQEITIYGHKPKKSSRRIYVVSSVKESRINYIKIIRAVFKECSHLYNRACQGYRVNWPPGVFPASHVPLYSAYG